MPTHPFSFFFFFNDTATTEIYTLSLHDALPIYESGHRAPEDAGDNLGTRRTERGARGGRGHRHGARSGDGRSHLRPVLHDEVRRPWHGALDLPINHRRPWRAPLGVSGRALPPPPSVSRARGSIPVRPPGLSL